MEVCFGQFFEDVSANEMHKIVDFFASACILIAKRVEDDTAIDINIFAEGVVLQCISSVYDRGSHILLFLSGLLAEKGLVVLEVLE